MTAAMLILAVTVVAVSGSLWWWGLDVRRTIIAPDPQGLLGEMLRVARDPGVPENEYRLHVEAVGTRAVLYRYRRDLARAAEVPVRDVRVVR